MVVLVVVVVRSVFVGALLMFDIVVCGVVIVFVVVGCCYWMLFADMGLQESE